MKSKRQKMLPKNVSDTIHKCCIQKICIIDKASSSEMDQKEGPFNGQNLSEVCFGLDHARNSFPFGQRGYIQESYSIPNRSSNGGKFLILFETERGL